GTAWRIGHETVEMTVGVLAALIAVFALVDTAAFNEEQKEKQRAEAAELGNAARDLEAAAKGLRAAETTLRDVALGAPHGSTSPKGNVTAAPPDRKVAAPKRPHQ